MEKNLANQVGEFTARVITLEAKLEELESRLNSRLTTAFDSNWHKIDVFIGNMGDEMVGVSKECLNLIKRVKKLEEEK